LDPDRLAAYLRENGPYFHPVGWYQIGIDRELKELGIPNDAPDFLDRIVDLIEQPEQERTARSILERYTTGAFPSADAWRQWVGANRDRVFFSETAGYKWIVDRAASAE